MTTADDLAGMVARLGCPAAVCPDLDPQIAEIRQKRWLGERPLGAQALAMHAALAAPRLIVTYAGNIGVVTFHHPDADDSMAHLHVAAGDLRHRTGGTGQLDSIVLHIDGRAYPASFATTVTTTPMLERLMSIARPRRRYAQIGGPSPVIAYGARVGERSVVIVGPSNRIRGIRLEWLAL